MSLKQGSSLMGLLRLQFVVGVFGFLALSTFSQMNYALSYACGVLLMVANGWWLAIRIDKTVGLDVESSQRSLYAGAVIRFVSLIAGLLLAQLIGLHLLLVAAGMFVAQVVVYVAALLGFKLEQDENRTR